ncbi:hypothetical protein BDW62DRAFT_108631 [Aspergillus aurantiobrunneus]
MVTARFRDNYAIPTNEYLRSIWNKKAIYKRQRPASRRFVYRWGVTDLLLRSKPLSCSLLSLSNCPLSSYFCALPFISFHLIPSCFPLPYSLISSLPFHLPVLAVRLCRPSLVS